MPSATTSPGSDTPSTEQHENKREKKSIHETSSRQPQQHLIENQGYRGRCLYKTGKCENERAIKTNGQAHNLCDMHRLRQNQNQRKLDGKNRNNRANYNHPYSREQNTSDRMTNESKRSPRELKNDPSINSSPRSNEEYVTPNTGATQLPSRQYFTSTPSSPPQYPGSYAAQSTSYIPAPPMHFRPPPPPHASYPNAPSVVKPEFADEITVPTPSYLKGEAREAFRSRVLQKLVNIISEEVMTTQQPNSVAPYPTTSYPPEQAPYEYHTPSYGYSHIPPNYPPPPSVHYTTPQQPYPHSYYDRPDPYRSQSNYPVELPSTRSNGFHSSPPSLPKFQLPSLLHKEKVSPKED